VPRIAAAAARHCHTPIQSLQLTPVLLLLLLLQ
jgi:hypothetical protein